MKTILLALACLVGASATQAQSESSPVTHPPAGAMIEFLDVGQGDAILIRSDTFNVLIDAGSSGHIMRDLLDRGVHHLHLLIASHNHDDHIGDMDDVVRNMKVDEFIDNACHENSRAQRNLLTALQRYQVPIKSNAADTVHFGNLALEIFPSSFMTCDTTQNNLSIGVIVRVGRFSALLTGDSETYEENAWAGAGLIPDVDVLKAAHHGAENGAAPYWLQEANPEIVVISLGKNGYGHPSRTALRRYEASDRKVYRTDQHGTVAICVQPDGGYGVLLDFQPSFACIVTGPSER